MGNISGANFSIFSASMVSGTIHGVSPQGDYENAFKDVLNQVSDELSPPLLMPNGKFGMIEMAITQAVADGKLTEEQRTDYLNILKSAKELLPLPPRPAHHPPFAAASVARPINSDQMASFDFSPEPPASATSYEQCVPMNQDIHVQMILAATIGGRDLEGDQSDLGFYLLKNLESNDPYGLFANSNFVRAEITHVSVVQADIQGVLDLDDTPQSVQTRLANILETSKKYIDMLMVLLTKINPDVAQSLSQSKVAISTPLAPPIPIVPLPVPKDKVLVEDPDPYTIEAI